MVDNSILRHLSTVNIMQPGIMSDSVLDNLSPGTTSQKNEHYLFLEKYKINNFYQINDIITTVEAELSKICKKTLRYIMRKGNDFRSEVEEDIINDLGFEYLKILDKVTKTHQKDALEYDVYNVLNINNVDSELLIDMLYKRPVIERLIAFNPFIQNIPEDLQIKLLKNNLASSTYMTVSNCVLLKIIKTHPMIISFIKDISLSLYVEAVSINRDTYLYIPKDKLSAEIELAYKTS